MSNSVSLGRQINNALFLIKLFNIRYRYNVIVKEADKIYVLIDGHNFSSLL